MVTKIQIGDLIVEVSQKDIKNVHLSVHPPAGRVTIASPRHLSISAVRAFAIGKLSWIRQQQRKLQEQERETPREYLDRESHYVWGRRCLLRIIECNKPPVVEWRHHRLILRIRPKLDERRRAEIVEAWYRTQLREEAKLLITVWEQRLGVRLKRIFIQSMKTRWGSCNPSSRTIRLNTDLAKKPKELLEYVLVHELMHILEPTHNARFIALMSQFLPGWELRRDQLNRLPLRNVDWKH